MSEVENKDEIINNDNDKSLALDSAQKTKDLASLFGQSENQLKKEFGCFKAKKIYKKLSYFVDTKALLREELIKNFQNAKKWEFSSVSVYPTQVALAKLVLRGTSTKVRALINFPSGEEFFKVTKKGVLKVFESGADEVAIMISSYSILNDHFKEQAKHIKRLIKKFKKRSVIIMLDVTSLTPIDIEKGLKAVKGCEAQAITLVNFKGGFDKSVILESVLALNGKAYLECFCNVSSLEDAVTMLLDGVSVLTLSNAPSIAKELSDKVNLVGEDIELLDKSQKEAYN